MSEFACNQRSIVKSCAKPIHKKSVRCLTKDGECDPLIHETIFGDKRWENASQERHVMAIEYVLQIGNTRRLLFRDKREYCAVQDEIPDPCQPR